MCTPTTAFKPSWPRYTSCLSCLGSSKNKISIQITCVLLGRAYLLIEPLLNNLHSRGSVRSCRNGRLAVRSLCTCTHLISGCLGRTHGHLSAAPTASLFPIFGFGGRSPGRIPRPTSAFSLPDFCMQFSSFHSSAPREMPSPIS